MHIFVHLAIVITTKLPLFLNFFSYLIFSYYLNFSFNFFLNFNTMKPHIRTYSTDKKFINDTRKSKRTNKSISGIVSEIYSYFSIQKTASKEKYPLYKQ